MDEQTHMDGQHSPAESQPQPEGHTPEGGVRRRLGRGLNSLLGNHDAPAASEDPIPADAETELRHIEVDAIQRNPYQPRKDFDLQALNELVESINQHGVLQPLLVRLTPEGYQLIAGERRWLASRDAGLKTVPCRVLKLEDKAVSEVAIIENLQREDLNELEKAQAFQSYIEQFGCSIEDVAKKLGKDRSTISNSLRLLELPAFVKEALRAGKISAGHGRALLPLEAEADQIAMCQRIQSESMSVRSTEQAIRQQLEEKQQTVPFKPGEKRPTPSAAQKLTNHIMSLQDQLREVVGVKVEIKLKGKDAGKMVIHFNSNEEFERIVQQLRKAS
jgi:ParB family chromosome partitioning protein